MPKLLRKLLILPGQPNHFVCRGNNRRRLFSYPKDYRTYIRLLAKAGEDFGCRFHALCLMANHVHTLMTPPSVGAASSLMKRVNQRYAQIRNEQRAGSGKIFEQSFFSEPIVGSRHLAFCVLYIDANPYKANLRNQQSYRWSTLALHSGRGEETTIFSNMVENDSWYEALGSTDVERQAEYCELFSSYLAGEVGDEFAHRGEPRQPAQYDGRRPTRPNGSSAAERRRDFG
ncbi:MAG: transposase [Myxococcales bacterium]|nr:transposase [Myxococcales bacterium]